MEIKYLNKKNNKNLIVFFNGWGFDESPVKHLAFSNFDVVIIYDYKNVEKLNLDFSNYEKKYLIAWSLGVFVCNLYYEHFFEFNEIIAVNGTQSPVDDNFGIPVNAYDLTINNFNDLTLKKFVKKIGCNCDINRNNESLKQELINIRNLKINNYLNFTKAIISTKDRIFPYQNMLNFWKEKNVKTVKIETFHYPFGLYKNWSDLI